MSVTITRKLNRTPMRLAPALVQTFAIRAPLSTHWRPVTCEEAGCGGFDPKCGRCTSGWDSVIDERTELGLAQATYIRQGSGRTFRELSAGPGVTVFRFEGHQRCFADHEPHQHMKRVDRQERFLVIGGDHRGNPLRTRREHTRPWHWQEEFAENQDRLKTAIERG